MSEKKNIDRLFQEKFKDFEEAPPEFVWDNIREDLQEKKKRRVIPLWIRLSGVAAALIIGIFFLQPYIPRDNSNPVVNGAEGRPGDKVNPATNPVKAGRPAINNNEVIPGGNNVPVIVYGDGKGKATPGYPSTGANDNSNAENKPGASASGKNNAVAYQHHNGKHTTSGKNSNGNNPKGAGTHPLYARPDEAVANAGTAPNKHNNNRWAHNNGGHTAATNSGGIQTDGGIAEGTPTSLNKHAATAQGNTIGRNPASPAGQNNSGLAQTGSTSGTNKHRGGTPGNANSGTVAPGTQDNGGVAQAGKPANNANDNGIGNNSGSVSPENAVPATNINKGLAVNEAAAQAIDTVKPVPENELEKLLREQQEAKKEDNKALLAENSNAGKWNVKPQLAPVFYNSLSQGSPIDGQFAGNSKNYDTNLSYGVGVNYAVTSKLSIRSGINTVNLNYATQGVEFYASLNGQTNNVAAKAKGANIVVKDQGTQTNSAGLALFTDSMKQDTFSGSMLQKTGYVEVPVEMAYAVLNHKFGIDIIGGVSTLFLNQNNVSVISSQGLSTDVGQAQNLNNIHFSTNVGLGFKYRFFKSFQANFEPTFKYQVNAYSRDAGNFKPYFIGLYSGISFSF